MKPNMLVLIVIVGCFACARSTENKAEQESNEPAIALVKDTFSLSLVNTSVINDTASLQKFDQTQWKTKRKDDYPYRESLYRKILYSKAFRQLQKEGVLDLLGPPDRVDSLYLFYLIRQKRLGSFPLSTKTLVVKLTEEDKVEKVLVHE